MASSFPNGTRFSIGTVYGSDLTVSAITNANPGVATSTAHGLTDGDIIVVTSGWPQLSGSVVRVDGATANDFQLEGVNTTSTTQYPAGQGTGTVKEVTTWVGFSQITNSETSGGDQQFYQWQYLEESTQRQRPTVKGARALAMTLDYDPSLAWHQALLDADQLGTPHAIRAALPNGSFIYYHMYVAFDGEPTFTINTNQQVSLSLSFDNPRSRRYAA